MGSCTLSSGGVCVVVVLLCLAACCLTCARGAVPAIYVLGDSQADVGNNNYLLHSLLKANFPHNGIDYPGGKPTGRFSNGYNFVDLIGEYISIIIDRSLRTRTYGHCPQRIFMSNCFHVLWTLAPYVEDMCRPRMFKHDCKSKCLIFSFILILIS
jgi:hypothetical protein